MGEKNIVSVVWSDVTCDVCDERMLFAAEFSVGRLWAEHERKVVICSVCLMESLGEIARLARGGQK